MKTADQMISIYPITSLCFIDLQVAVMLQNMQHRLSHENFQMEA